MWINTHNFNTSYAVEMGKHVSKQSRIAYKLVNGLNRTMGKYMDFLSFCLSVTTTNSNQRCNVLISNSSVRYTSSSPADT
ncbi:unnamed protein product [Acanthoscelides obtectus]|nr:unnamed protein product [Acanthoscelides obtectus]CAK1624312.1 hypothetical protein AOBTE_LOCUS2487 [Acanthoscelides obtectus]